MRHKPLFTYSGLTIVLSNPSRFDLKEGKLLSANSGLFFKEECLRPELNYLQCDIRTSDTIGEGLLEGTKALLLLGEEAFKKWTLEREYEKFSLNQQRGCPLISKFSNIPTIASYTPQDAFDSFKDYESTHNPLLTQMGVREEYAEDKDKGDEKDSKDFGKTARRNFRFWLKHDTKRIISALQGKTKIPPEVKYYIYPRLELVNKLLYETKGQNLYLDIECSEKTFNLWCIGLSFGLPIILVVPIFRFNGDWAYNNISNFLSALSVSLRDNRVILHNASFDLFVLCHRYKIPFGHNIYDTMLAHHRTFVDVEKSLGHAMSHLTWLPYHKDERISAPNSPHQERQLWEYNGKDVYGTILVHQALEELANKNPGLRDSIDQSNRCIYPYLLNTFFGIKFSEKKRRNILDENDRKMMQFLRFIRILSGGETILPSSNKQMVEYFHDRMNYPVISRSEKTRKPSLEEKNIYKLRLKLKDRGIENPILDIAIAYRRLKKESGTIGDEWIPWKI